MDINPSTLVLLTTGSTLLGIVVTSVFNLIGARSARRSEERRQTKELVVTAAVENWKYTTDVLMKIGRKGMQAPLDVFLIHMLTTADVIFDPTTNAANLEDRLKRVDDITAIAVRRADRLTAQGFTKTAEKE
jgi:hypothetical protein